MNKNDWRLTNQMNYLFRKTVVRKQYESFRKGWEHDHCEFCGTQITALSPIAYATEDDYHWICDTCFRDFREMFKWKVKEQL